MVVVSDTSPLTNLIKIKRLDLLKRIYPKILIPKAVYQELLLWENDAFDSSIIDPAWIEICEVQNRTLLNEIKIGLDDGEAEAIVLAIEKKADLLIIDERKGWRAAKNKGLNAIGLIGVLLKAKSMNLIPKVLPVIDELRTDAGFWLSDEFYEQIRKAVKEE